MAQVEGVVESMRVDQEGGSVVLRFVLQTDGEARIPVEMRGQKVSGVLRDGDRVRLSVEGKSVRGSDGVARPAKLTNLSTNSVVSVPGGGMVGGMVSLVVSVVVSALSGILSAVLIALITGSTLSSSAAPEGSAVPTVGAGGTAPASAETAESGQPTFTPAPGGTADALTPSPGIVPTTVPRPAGGQSAFPILTLLAGFFVALVVFFMLYVWPRLGRRARKS
jgi:hypothetical protein